MAKKEKDPKPNSVRNGGGLTKEDLTEAILAMITPFQDRIEALEDERGAKRLGDEAQLKLINRFFDADMDGMLEVGRIAPMSRFPMGDALTLNSLMDDDILNGEVTLLRKGIYYGMRLDLSAGGYNRMMGMKAVTTQIGAEARQEEEGEGGHYGDER